MDSKLCDVSHKPRRSIKRRLWPSVPRKKKHAKIKKENMGRMKRQCKQKLFEETLPERQSKQELWEETLPGDDWLSCQVDVNKLVQRIGSKRNAVSLDEAGPEETRDVDKDQIILEIEPEPCKIINEAFLPDLDSSVKNDVKKSEDIALIDVPFEKLDDEFMPDATDLRRNDDDNTCDPPPNINEEWVIEKRLCRGCHAEGDFISLQATDSIESISYEDMLANCSDIKLCPTEYLALQALCPLCCARLRDALAFFRQVRAAETRFQTLYHNNSVIVAGSTTDDKLIKEEPTEESDVERKEMEEELDPEQQKTSIARKTHKRLQKGKRERKVMEKELGPEQQKTCIARKPRKRLQNGKPLPPKVLTKEYVQEGDNYKCTKCDKICVTLKDCIQHNKKEHLKKSWCTLCQIPFENVNLKNQHKRKEHKSGVVQEKRYKCNACDKKFKKSHSLQSHLDEYHMLGEKVKCSSCDYECYSKKRMRRHMVVHKTSRDFACKYCKKTFMRKTTLIFHEKIHTGDKQKKCAECGQAFVQKASLNYHMTKHHPEVRF